MRNGGQARADAAVVAGAPQLLAWRIREIPAGTVVRASGSGTSGGRSAHSDGAAHAIDVDVDVAIDVAVDVAAIDIARVGASPPAAAGRPGQGIRHAHDAKYRNCSNGSDGSI
jgi:hypothetical protein